LPIRAIEGAEGSAPAKEVLISAKPQPAVRENYTFVHSLRGIAAMWVVLFHAEEGRHIDTLLASIPHWANLVFDLGNNGVAIFFALSGFVIAHSLRNDWITPGYVGRFALRRSIRLDPSYWASMILFVGFAGLSAAVKGEAFGLPPFKVIAANVTYTQLFAGLPSINVVYWTLCYEVQFYLVLILFVMAAQRFGRGVYLIALAAALAWGSGLLANPIQGLFLDRWHCFYLGALACWAKSSRMSLAGFVLLALVLSASEPGLFTIISVGTAAALLAANGTGYIKRGLAWRPLLFLGTISYSLYLTHNPITGAAFFVLERLGVSQLVALVATIAACVAGAAIFWLVVERPTMSLARRVKLPRNREVESGFAAMAAPTS
jgi:peptidoglycan/LPS O-acetylase OafA/YrhL